MEMETDNERKGEVGWAEYEQKGAAETVDSKDQSRKMRKGSKLRER